MSKKTKRLKSEKMKRAIERLRKNNTAATQSFVTAKNTPESKNFIEMCSEKIVHWFDDSEWKVLFYSAILYFVGVALYAGIGKIFGFPFWISFGSIFACAVIAFIGVVITITYQYVICESMAFSGPRSWLVRSGIFYERHLKKADLRIQDYLNTLEDRKRAFIVTLMMIPFLPSLLIAFAIIHILLLAVIILDVLRLLTIGFVNLCLLITPARTLGNLVLAFISWASLGVAIAFFLYDKNVGLLSTYFVLGIMLGGMVGTCLSLLKGQREMESRRGNPFFPI